MADSNGDTGSSSTVAEMADARNGRVVVNGGYDAVLGPETFYRTDHSFPDAPARDPAVYEIGERLERAVDQNPNNYKPGTISVKPDGVYVKMPYRKSWLDDPDEGSAAGKEYERIQREFREKNGRSMDHAVAIIRARLATGEITKSKAREIAYYLRGRRDRAIARDAMREYARDKGVDPATLDPKMFYVPTTRTMLKAMEGGREQFRERLLGEINSYTDRTQMDVGAAGPADLTGMRQYYLAKRFGFNPVLSSELVDVRNPEADKPANYKPGSKLRKAAAARLRIADEERLINEARGAKTDIDAIRKRTSMVLLSLGFSGDDRTSMYHPKMYSDKYPRYVKKPTGLHRSGRYTDPEIR